MHPTTGHIATTLRKVSFTHVHQDSLTAAPVKAVTAEYSAGY
jgi:hypothetical protein